MTHASVHIGLSGDAKRLIWDVFFVQAGRGVDFETHLPWSDAPETRSVMLRDASGAAVATAVIRPAPQDAVAMIGFVCVAARARGRGHGRTLIESSTQAIDAAGFQASLLWTGKPEVYADHGYGIVGRDHFLHVARRLPAGPATSLARSDPWPPLGSLSGLPAFAIAGSRYQSDRAQAVLVRGAKGVTLLDWQGDLADVMTLLDAAGLARWSVNIPEADPFLNVLDPDLFTVTTHPGALTMARRADSAVPLDYVAVADRI
ncbi:GNAT family N-acetyltransferase [Sphingomonas sp. SUN019]|uniref:GNAT family N-acetyltransferase n=1 Tax=Sphingomonas sp. SUN019 TaxID=2937788 RepID=UPI0021647539|nr:GNAT family N-acetyltransferase [Sphingomonas sp. SUN019]UVO50932.1 GNAT family N-acetyltransferase [Sphingomonas sp. SUN019]